MAQGTKYGVNIGKTDIVIKQADSSDDNMNMIMSVKKQINSAGYTFYWWGTSFQVNYKYDVQNSGVIQTFLVL